MVPLVGIMFSNIVMGVTNYLAYKYEMTQALSSWLVGHFSTVIRGRYELVWLTVPLVVLAFVFANHFNIVGMGKVFSQNLGVPYDLVLFMGLTIAAMITASVVVVVGSISYIGLIVPNIVAMFKGDQIRGTLVDTALFGAVFVLVCDMIGRVVIYPYVSCLSVCCCIGFGMDARQSGWAKLPRKPEVQHENAQKPSAPADPSASCSAGLRRLYDSGCPF